MPTENLSALNAASAPFRTGSSGNFTGSVSGTFVGTVQLQRRVSETGAWEPVARDLAGNFVQFTGPSGAIPLRGMYFEGNAEVRWQAVAYTSGTAVVRLGA